LNQLCPHEDRDPPRGRRTAHPVGGDRRSRTGRATGRVSRGRRVRRAGRRGPGGWGRGAVPGRPV